MSRSRGGQGQAGGQPSITSRRRNAFSDHALPIRAGARRVVSGGGFRTGQAAQRRGGAVFPAAVAAGSARADRSRSLHPPSSTHISYRQDWTDRRRRQQALDRLGNCPGAAAAGARLAVTYQASASENVCDLCRPRPAAASCDVTDDLQIANVFETTIASSAASTVVHGAAFARPRAQRAVVQTTRDGFRTSSTSALFPDCPARGACSWIAAAVVSDADLPGQRACLCELQRHGGQGRARPRCVTWRDLGRSIRVNAISAGPIGTLAASDPGFSAFCRCRDKAPCATVETAKAPPRRVLRRRSAVWRCSWWTAGFTPRASSLLASATGGAYTKKHSRSTVLIVLLATSMPAAAILTGCGRASHTTRSRRRWLSPAGEDRDPQRSGSPDASRRRSAASSPVGFREDRQRARQGDRAGAEGHRRIGRQVDASGPVATRAQAAARRPPTTPRSGSAAWRRRAPSAAAARRSSSWPDRKRSTAYRGDRRARRAGCRQCVLAHLATARPPRVWRSG